MCSAYLWVCVLCINSCGWKSQLRNFSSKNLCKRKSVLSLPKKPSNKPQSCYDRELVNCGAPLLDLWALVCTMQSLLELWAFMCVLSLLDFDQHQTLMPNFEYFSTHIGHILVSCVYQLSSATLGIQRPDALIVCLCGCRLFT